MDALATLCLDCQLSVGDGAPECLRCTAHNLHEHLKTIARDWQTTVNERNDALASVATLKALLEDERAKLVVAEEALARVTVERDTVRVTVNRIMDRADDAPPADPFALLSHWYAIVCRAKAWRESRFVNGIETIHEVDEDNLTDAVDAYLAGTPQAGGEGEK